MLCVFISRAALLELSACAPMRARVANACALAAPNPHFRAAGSQFEILHAQVTKGRTAVDDSRPPCVLCDQARRGPMALSHALRKHSARIQQIEGHLIAVMRTPDDLAAITTRVEDNAPARLQDLRTA